MKNNLSVFLVPTGIGASIGGFAGDASKYARAISERCSLIVNPNVVNAACFSGITENMLYTEGSAIDAFFKKEIALRESKGNKIGVIFDKAIPQDVLNVHINTINAVETVYGIEETLYEITEEEVGIKYEITAENISTGNIQNPDTLIKAGQSLLNKGCEALAIVCLFDEDENDEEYANGIGIDPVGGVEGIISHLITKELKVMSAHAPAFKKIDISKEIVNKKAAAEYITPTFLPCVLLGLNNAPKIIPISEKKEEDVTVDDVKNLIMPFNSTGCVPILEAQKRGINIILMNENKTALDVTPDKINLKNYKITNNLEDILKMI